MSTAEYQRSAKQERWRRWYEMHRGDQTARHAAYVEAHRPEINTYNRERRAQRSPEEIARERDRRHPPTAEQRERHRARERERYATESPEERRARNAKAAQWRAANPVLVQAVNAAVNANRMARRRGVPGSIARADVLALWERQPQCLDCGHGRGVDHVVPMSDGGPNVPTNLQNLCQACNSAKENRGRAIDPVEKRRRNAERERERRRVANR